MPDCEICGRPNARVYGIIEGAKLRLCGNCAKFARQILYVEPEPKKAVEKGKKARIITEEVLIDEYASVISKAREKKGLSRKELAELIFEKESFLRRIEEEKSPPSDQLARKLEKALNIELFEERTVERLKPEKRTRIDITLGDLVKLLKGKKK